MRSELKKDGSPNRVHRGKALGVWVSTYPRGSFQGNYAEFDAAREAQADVLRAEVSRLESELNAARQNLLRVYASDAVKAESAAVLAEKR
jgi:hypothetical protein